MGRPLDGRGLVVGPRQARMTPPETSAGLIDRPHLMQVLDVRPVTVLAGMAGFGKSTLLAAAAARHQLHGAALWLTIDDSDRDPVRLVSDLMSAAGLAGIDDLTTAIAPLRTSSLRAEPLTLVDAFCSRRSTTPPSPSSSPSTTYTTSPDRGSRRRWSTTAPPGTRRHAHCHRRAGRAAPTTAAPSARRSSLLSGA